MLVLAVLQALMYGKLGIWSGMSDKFYCIQQGKCIQIVECLA
jgi:hypothetical protein